MAQAALNVIQFNPFNASGDTYVQNTLTNNTGVELVSATLDYSNLLFDVANLSYNVARFDLNTDNVVDFVDDNLVSQLSPYLDLSVLSTGDVWTGWFGNLGSDGIVDLTHISGFPGFSYDPWSNTLDMDTRLILGNFLVEDPATNKIVGMQLEDTPSITDFATGSEGGAAGLNFEANGRGIGIVPEPSQYAAALGALALGLVATRRPKRKE